MAETGPGLRQPGITENPADCLPGWMPQLMNWLGGFGWHHHRTDAEAWVRNLLGVTVPSDDAPPAGPDGPPAFAWELARPDDPDIPPLRHRLLKALSQRAQWKAALLAARYQAAQGASMLTRSDSVDQEGRAS
ncbi:hypothetical protein OG559_11695 [Micromonospora sp. NBC_01405]|uniref:hypothetical protein n=1 Tax=Micromonospora sp. NBC_01405 TaxID=2903589 RepID=UPI003249B67D